MPRSTRNPETRTPDASSLVGAAVGLALVGLLGVLTLLAFRTPGERGFAGGADVGPAEPPSSDVSPHPCRLEELGRERPRLGDGRYVYVEPQAVLPDGEGILIAGQPTYTAIVDSMGRGSLDTEGGFFGIRIGESRIDLIPLPDGVDRVGWIRGVTRGPAHWGFLFDRLAPGKAVGAAPLGVAYAELRGGVWDSLEPIPVPGAELPVGVATASLVAADGPSFTLVTTPPGRGRAVSFWARSDARWRETIVWRPWVDDAVAWAGQGRVRIALTGLDASFTPRRAAVRTLEIVRPRADRSARRSPGHPTAAPHRHALGRPGERFHQPVLAGTARLDLGWLHATPGAATSAWVRIGIDRGEGGSPILLEPGSAALAGFAWDTRTSLWIAHRIDAVAGTGVHSLSFHLADSAGARLVGSIPYPFVGPFAATTLPSGDIVVTGAEAHFRPAGSFVRSLIIRLGIHCP
ncbi:MAG: hypothetical protein AMS19_04480 [Gemmatimonas sp. SG8_23]|nr:MAG: hypothetical protein AMS19_04480 [Gemmatimonas sp. SG8_23]